jgi:hypothetical protein
MSRAARAELVNAIQRDEIENGSQYAEDFARRHDLNPASVKSTISRLRRDLGKPLRISRQSAKATEDVAGEPVSALALLAAPDATDERFAKLAAAALVRYEEDDDFRAAVTGHREEMRSLYHGLPGLRKLSEILPGRERDDLLRVLGDDAPSRVTPGLPSFSSLRRR